MVAYMNDRSHVSRITMLPLNLGRPELKDGKFNTLKEAVNTYGEHKYRFYDIYDILHRFIFREKKQQQLLILTVYIVKKICTLT